MTSWQKAQMEQDDQPAEQAGPLLAWAVWSPAQGFIHPLIFSIEVRGDDRSPTWAAHTLPRRSMPVPDVRISPPALSGHRDRQVPLRRQEAWSSTSEREPIAFCWRRTWPVRQLLTCSAGERRFLFAAQGTCHHGEEQTQGSS